MFLIKLCPSCHAKLRFPLTKGKIRVTCVCGYSFTADPDDPALYRNAEFDLSEKSHRTETPGKHREFQFRRFFNFDAVIKELYIFKYRMQNFRLLPASEQKRILLKVTFIMLGLLLLYFTLCSSRTNVPSNFL